MNVQHQFAKTSISGRKPARIFCAAIFVLAALWPGGPAAAFNSFNALTQLESASGVVIVSDRDEGTDLIDPIPPNTAFTSFIGGDNFARMPTSIPTRSSAWKQALRNRLDKLTSSASFSLDNENPFARPQRMNLGFLIFPGQLQLIAQECRSEGQYFRFRGW